MITVFVQFSMPKFKSRKVLAQDFANISGMFYNVPGLMRKYFVIADDGYSAGGIYLWESRAAAEAFYTENFMLITEERYGTVPKITYFDCPVVVDNQFHYEFHNLVA